MKGSLHTDELMHAVMHEDTGLRTGAAHQPRLHPRRSEPIRGRSSSPTPRSTFSRRSKTSATSSRTPSILRARSASRTPKVAILSAVETVNPKIPSTVEAAALCKMADRSQITGGILDGPLAFDNAIESSRRPAIKKHRFAGRGPGRHPGRPDLEAGNMLAKQLTFMAGADAAGIVLGARVPIILTSRANSTIARLASSAVAALVAQARREQAAKAVV